MAEMPMDFWSRAHWPRAGEVSWGLGYVGEGGEGVGGGWVLRWGLERERER